MAPPPPPARAAPAALLDVVRAGPVPAGWTGKLWAASEGIRAARRFQPEYLLLTDADIVHPPENLSALVARAGSCGYDMVSFMATLECRTFAERALIPAFVFFFFMLYPPAWMQPRRGRPPPPADASSSAVKCSSVWAAWLPFAAR